MTPLNVNNTLKLRGVILAMFDRNSIDIERYESKFVKVDNWLKGDRKDIKTYGEFLHDPSLFAYLHQRVDGSSLRYYPYQDLIANDKHRFKYFRAANQIGKSLLLDSLAARNLIIDHGHAHNEAIVSKSLPQSTFQMRRIKTLLRTMPEINWKDVRGETDSLSVISVDVKDDAGNVKYTNMLICAPCTEGLLGYDLHSLNLDEFEFWEVDQKYFFNQIAQPRTYSTKGKITVFSNPNGADNFGAELEEQKLLNGKNKWHVYVFNYLDKPGNTQEEYDQLKNELSRGEFESTVAAIRSMSDKCFFSRMEIDASEDKSLSESSLYVSDRQPFFFLDVAAKFDRSVLVGGWTEPDKNNPEFKHVYIPIIHKYPQGYPISLVVGSPTESSNIENWSYQKSVREYLLSFSSTGIQPIFGCDITGNSGISPLFQACKIYPIDVVFSGPQKSGYYQKFKYYMEKKLLHRIKNKDWESEASQLVVTKSVRGYLLINAAGTVDGKRDMKLDSKLKKTPDDTMDATAGLIYLMDNHDIIIPTVTII